jgi:hypothetical protein
MSEGVLAGGYGLPDTSCRLRVLTVGSCGVVRGQRLLREPPYAWRINRMRCEYTVLSFQRSLALAYGLRKLNNPREMPIKTIS